MSAPSNTLEIQDAAASVTSLRAVITVTFKSESSPPDPRKGSLRIEPRRICAQPGATVLWRFRGLPAGHVPLIHFASGAKGTFDPGPFPALCLAPSGFTGVVAQRTEGEWPYQVSLHPVPGQGSAPLDLDSHGAFLCVGPDEPRDPQNPGT